MPHPCSSYPDVRTLARGLESILGTPVTVLSREVSAQGTFPSEIVTCGLDKGSKLVLFCKYSVDWSYNTYGHKWGVEYEALVYRHLLRPSGASVPVYHGTYKERENARTWLVLEYLEDFLKVSKAPTRTSLVDAAGWLGEFHAASARRVGSDGVSRLNKYDEEYYLGWARRACEFAAPLNERFPWMPSLCEGFEELVVELLAPQPTVIHGEFYPDNVLAQGAIIKPIDWESAALAIGEIDLASLTEGWPSDTLAECKLAYRRGLSLKAPRHDLERALQLARLYWHLRWLGDNPSWTNNEEIWRFEELRSLGEEIGLIQNRIR